jgi:hypothetical protein
MSEKEVKPSGKESLPPANAFRAKLDKIFSDFAASRHATRQSAMPYLARDLRITTHHAIKVAITVADMTTSEGYFRTKIQLIVDAAVVRAIGSAAETIERAMVAESPRQIAGLLPIDRHSETGRRRSAVCGARRRATETGKESERRGSYAASHAALHSRTRDKTAAPDTSTIGGASVIADASLGGQSPAADAGRSGSRTVKRDPSLSLLRTSTLPPCSSTVILTR